VSQWGARCRMSARIKRKKFFASFFQKRSSFLKERTKELLSVWVRVMLA
jgi:hypothetical protein